MLILEEENDDISRDVSRSNGSTLTGLFDKQTNNENNATQRNTTQHNATQRNTTDHTILYYIISNSTNSKSSSIFVSMTAPDSKTLQSLSGKWKLNKDLSDDFVPVLELQGVNIIIRKAVKAASVHLKIDQPSLDQLNMSQTATAASIPGTTEEYILDWEWRDSNDAFFGDIQGRSRWISQTDGAKETNADCWIKGDSKDKLIQAVGQKPDGAWVATHLWGFELVDGARRHTRRVCVRSKSGQTLNVRMVYDFEGE